MNVRRWYSRTYDWRSLEYSKIEALRAGFSDEKFKEVLGSPVFVREVSDAGEVMERSFQGRDYWIQTISDAHGTVILFAITVCESDFRPRFAVPGGPTVTLGESTLASLGGRDLNASYQFVTVTASRRMMDLHYGGNPGNYKAFAWGLNDACATFDEQLEAVKQAGVDLAAGKFRYEGPADEGGPPVQRFREVVKVNTYAETAPKIDWADPLLQQVRVGVDRVLVRTVPARTK